MNAADLRTLATVAALPSLLITKSKLRSLPEYSCSLPTGTTAGKQWKLDPWAYLHRPKAPFHEQQWVVAQYDDHPTDPTLMMIHYFRPVVFDDETTP